MKRTMKKAMSILAASAVLALTLAGCGNESTDPATTDGSDTDSASTVSGTVATNGSTSMEKVIGNLKAWVALYHFHPGLSPPLPRLSQSGHPRSRRRPGGFPGGTDGGDGAQSPH